MIKEYGAIAYHYCAPCGVESAETSCWICGKAMQPVPYTDEHDRSTLAWQIAASTVKFKEEKCSK